MAQGKISLQANDGKIAGLVFEDGAATDVSVTVPKEGGTLANESYVETAANNVKAATVAGVRQTVQYASTDANGLPNFISIGTGLAVNISATAKNIKISAAGGDTDRVGRIAADTVILGLSTNTINYLYADIASDGTVTLGSTALPPVYQFGGTPSIVANQSTFNISEMSMYVGNGTVAVKTYRVFLGEAVTNASAVTSVVNYALNGRYVSPLFALPALATRTAYSCNIGTDLQKTKFEAINITGDIGFTPGMRTGSLVLSNNTHTIPATPYVENRNTLGFTSGVSSYMGIHRTTGTMSYFTIANWNAQITAQRDF